jgi:hypothetical protein
MCTAWGGGSVVRWFGVSGVWAFWVGQPAGLPEGSRRSPGVMGAATSGQRRRRAPCTPDGVPDSSLPSLLEIGVAPENRVGTRQVAAVTSPRLWHPAGVLDHPTRSSGGRSPFALNDHRLPSANPAGWPPPVSSAENVQAPERKLEICATPPGWHCG